MHATIFVGYISLLFILCCGAHPPIELARNVKHKYTTKKGADGIYCFFGKGNTSDPSYLFDEVLIHVNETRGNKLPWYSVKGVSSDDLHSHLEDFVHLVLSKMGMHREREEKAPYEKSSIVRDMASSCPNPLYSPSRSECTMRFSSIGTACVRITPPEQADQHLVMTVYAEERVNMNYIYSFLCAAAAFFAANYLAYSIFFQYAAGAILFVIAGVLATFLLFLRYIVRARSGRTKWLRNLIIALLLSGAYVTTGLWYLRHHWHDLVFRYWEYVLGYLAVSAVAGMVAVQIQRKDAKDRHRLAVIVKWMIRSIALVVLYNSTASPYGSLTLVSLTVLLYVTYSMYKPKNVFPVSEAHEVSGGEGIAKAAVAVGLDRETASPRGTAASAETKKQK